MALRSANEVTPVAHVPYSTSAGSPFWQQANTTYQTGLALTQLQRETAMFWRDNPHTSGLPSGHWMQIARQVCEQQQHSLARTLVRRIQRCRHRRLIRHIASTSP